jgi:hypothetical protein
MTLPTPIFIGFLPKVVEPSPAWLEVESVQEICSVSECISKAPENRIQLWKHNSLGFYSSEEDARTTLIDAPKKYEWFAYEIFPFRGLNHTTESDDVSLEIGRVPADYEFLGYDIVTRSSGSFFECSPLSCNGAAQDFPTNVHCLIDNEQQAFQAFLEMSKPESGVEPGPYYLFKVYRKKRA